jgi:hypothetical protein
MNASNTNNSSHYHHHHHYHHPNHTSLPNTTSSIRNLYSSLGNDQDKYSSFKKLSSVTNNYKESSKNLATSQSKSHRLYSGDYYSYDNTNEKMGAASTSSNYANITHHSNKIYTEFNRYYINNPQYYNHSSTSNASNNNNSQSVFAQPSVFFASQTGGSAASPMHKVSLNHHHQKSCHQYVSHHRHSGHYASWYNNGANQTESQTGPTNGSSSINANAPNASQIHQSFI